MKMLAKIIAVLLTFYSVAAHAGVPDWSVSEFNGSVTVVKTTGAAVTATRGTVLRVGDIISTGSRSRAVVVRQQEFVILAENSRIVIAAPKPGSKVQIVQSSGNAVYKINKKSTPHFSVQTPYLAAVVKGTTFSVTVGSSGASVQVIEGRVQVIANEGEADHLLTPGEIGLVEAKSPNRLTVQSEGKEIVLDSPAAVVDSPTAMPDVAPAAPQPAAEVEEQTTISQDVSEGSIRLEDMTDGLVSGDVSLAILTPPAQSDRDNSGDNGNGSGSDDSSDGSSDNGNGGSDNGNGGGSDNGGGTDNGSGSGSDNGNGGSSDNNSGGDSDNGNGSGSDNGSDGGSDTGNGAGSDNGNGGSNDNDGGGKGAKDDDGKGGGKDKPGKGVDDDGGKDKPGKGK